MIYFIKLNTGNFFHHQLSRNNELRYEKNFFEGSFFIYFSESLIEVVNIEHQVAIRSSKDTKIKQVVITAKDEQFIRRWGRVPGPKPIQPPGHAGRQMEIPACAYT